jgi:membrane-associated phospholipid phosphatase
MIRAQKISAIEWAIIAVIVLIDAALMQITGLSVKTSPANIEALSIVFILWPLTFLLIQTTGFAKGAEVIPENVAKYFIFIAAASVLEYYVVTTSLPLHDASLIQFDRMLGFDWPQFYQWVYSHYWAHRLLAFCYGGLMVEAGVVLLVVSPIYPQRGRRFLTALIVSALIAIVFAWAFPVEGPFAHYGHTDLPLADYTQYYAALRAHTLPFIPLDHLRGIVSFPSFHVSSAVIMTYFLRRLRVLFPLSIVLNIGMSIGSLVIGGHYLADVLAGIALGLVTITVIVWLEKNEPEKALPFSRVKSYSSHQLSSTKP